MRDYKPLAALYCLLEAQNNTTLVDPDYLISNRTTILEHLTSGPIKVSDVKDNIIEEYSKYDKDLKLLTFKILLEKFNDKYKNLSDEQKNILREFITSVNSTTRLRNIINEELKKFLKSKEISEDEEKKFEKVIQEYTDNFVKQIDDKVLSKEKEIMTI